MTQGGKKTVSYSRVKQIQFYVGDTSMEIRVDTFIESKDRTYTLANRAYLTYVALDVKGQPTKVSGLIPDTQEERMEWEAGGERARIRVERRKNSKKLNVVKQFIF